MGANNLRVHTAFSRRIRYYHYVPAESYPPLEPEPHVPLRDRPRAYGHSRYGAVCRRRAGLKNKSADYLMDVDCTIGNLSTFGLICS
jgi:hypothetical protein